jgi:ATP-binding cassette subfamily B protein
MPYQGVILVCTLCASALGLVAPLILKWLIDDVLPSRWWGGLLIATGVAFGTSAARTLLSAAAGYLNTVAVQRLVFGLRVRLFKRLQALPPAFHARQSVGDLVQRVDRDVALIGDMGSDVAPAVLRMTLETTLTIVTLLVLDWRLTSVVLPLVAPFAYVRSHFRLRLQRAAEEARASIGRQSGFLNEALIGTVQVQLLGAESRFARRFAWLGLKAMSQTIRQRRQELGFTLLSMNIIGLGTTLMVGYGGWRVMSGQLSTGSLVAFCAYIGGLFSPMQTAVEFYARLSRVRASIRRVMEIEDAPGALVEAPDAAPLSLPPRLLACSKVSFGYSAEQPTLRRIDAAILAGERVAVVGGSGSGKTSLLTLIPRLYDTIDGCIEIDGRDIRGVELRSLRRAISFVPQHPVLFEGTLRDNLRHGNPTANAHDIARAAWIAGVTQVVERLPRGWDTMLGSLGTGLSGGEKQRIAIARALLQDRPILILDEATSALDVPTEHGVLSRIDAWRAGRIVIVVSHRLAVARWADRVILLHCGEVVEDGAHRELYRPGTQYYELWRRVRARRARLRRQSI